MKKIFSVILVLALLLSMAVTCYATGDEYEIMTDWKLVHGKVNVENKTEDGEKVVAFSGMTQTYHTAGVDILPKLKELIVGNDKITVNLSADVKIEYAEDCDGDDVTIGMLIRAEGIIDALRNTDNYKEFCSGNTIKVISGTAYGTRVAADVDVYDDWETLEGEVTLTANDILAGLWNNIYLCFDNIKPVDSVKKIFVKNACMTVVDKEAGKGEVTIDLDKLINGPGIDPNLKYEDGDTPALPENNKLLEGAEFTTVAGLGTPVINKGDFNGAPMWSVTNIKSEWISPGINIYPSIKALMGDKNEVSVWIVLDVRALSVQNKEQPFGMKIRVPDATALTKEPEAFEENYEGIVFKNSGGSTGITASVYDNGIYTAKWQRIEMLVSFTSDEVNDEFWTTWNLCFDQMKECRYLQELQIKNVGIFLEDDYETVGVDESEEEESSGATANLDAPVIYNPIGFDKYGVTFTEGIDTPLPDGLTPDASSNVNDPSQGANGDDGSKSNTTLYIIIAAAAVVVIAGAVVVFIVIKKKKSVKEEN